MIEKSMYTSKALKYFFGGAIIGTGVDIFLPLPVDSRFARSLLESGSLGAISGLTSRSYEVREKVIESLAVCAGSLTGQTIYRLIETYL